MVFNGFWLVFNGFQWIFMAFWWIFLDFQDAALFRELLGARSEPDSKELCAISVALAKLRRLKSMVFHGF